MYSKSAFASVGLAAYFVMSSLARLINGPSGVDSIDAYNLRNETNSKSVIYHKLQELRQNVINYKKNTI